MPFTIIKTLERRVAVEATNVWVAIRRLLHFAFRRRNGTQGEI